MNIPCPVCIPCIDPSEPTVNYSTEDPDVDHFFCYGSSNGSLQPGAGYNWNVGNCNIVWGPVSCAATTSELCQSCVQQSRWSCDPSLPGGEPPGTGPIVDPNGDPVPVYANHFQVCSANCPTGEAFQAFAIPGAIYDRSQTLADRKALTLACETAHLRRICLSALSEKDCCVGSRYRQTITATGGFSVFNRNLWQIVSGSLPPGISFDGGVPRGAGTTATLFGIPTAAGSYTFTVRITAVTGDFMQKQYTICVIDITPETLPDGTVGTAYSQTLTATNCATPALSWQVAAGLLPDGLTLDEETGKISGTPTTAGTYAFRIILQTQAT